MSWGTNAQGFKIKFFEIVAICTLQSIYHYQASFNKDEILIALIYWVTDLL